MQFHCPQSLCKRLQGTMRPCRGWQVGKDKAAHSSDSCVSQKSKDFKIFLSHTRTHTHTRNTGPCKGRKHSHSLIALRHQNFQPVPSPKRGHFFLLLEASNARTSLPITLSASSMRLLVLSSYSLLRYTYSFTIYTYFLT